MRARSAVRAFGRVDVRLRPAAGDHRGDREQRQEQQHGPHGREQHHRHEQLQHDARGARPGTSIPRKRSPPSERASSSRFAYSGFSRCSRPGRAAAELDQLRVEGERVEVAELERDGPDEVADRDARRSTGTPTRPPSTIARRRVARGRGVRRRPSSRARTGAPRAPSRARGRRATYVRRRSIRSETPTR